MKTLFPIFAVLFLLSPAAKADVVLDLSGPNIKYGLDCSQSQTICAKVDKAYRQILGRAPDRAGFKYWVDQLKSGVTEKSMTDSLYNSAEKKSQQAKKSSGAAKTTSAASGSATIFTGASSSSSGNTTVLPPTIGNAESYLRRSCYCIDCYLKTGVAVDQQGTMATQISQTGCKYVRWAAFSWDFYSNRNSSAANTSRHFADFSEFVQKLPADTVAEYGVPEIVSKNFVENISVTEAERQLLGQLAEAHDPEMKGFSAFNYDEMRRNDANPDFWGSGHPNGIPNIDTKSGWNYHLLFFIRAFDRGARGFYLSQANIRFREGVKGKEKHFESLIKALRAYAKQKNAKIIFGSESLVWLYENNTISPNTSLVDYVKYITDVDIAEYRDNKFIGYRHDGSPMNCRGQSILEKFHMRTSQSSKGQRVGALCTLENDPDGMRVHNSSHSYRGLPMERNNGRWPMMMELDGCSDCQLKSNPSAGANVNYYKNLGDESVTTCYSYVRNGLTNTMLFLSQPKQTRMQFGLYMARLAQELKSQFKVPVYFPQSLKVDQNHMWQLTSNHYKLTNAQWEEQKNRVRTCPKEKEGAGKAHNNSLNYNAAYCEDTDIVKAALSSALLSASTFDPKMWMSIPTAPTPVAASVPKFQSGGADLGILSAAQSKSLNDQSYIEALFRSVHGRAGEAQGVSYYVYRLKRGEMSREEIRREFVNSEEGRVALKGDNRGWVKRIYRSLLRREPESSGENHWVSLLDSGTSRSEIIRRITGSPEYKSIPKD